MKSRSEVWLKALEDLGRLCSVSTQRDAETMASRVAAEGESFFTLTLPAFGKEFERTLAEERIPSSAFKGWARRPVRVGFFNAEGVQVESTMAKVGAPKFLGGFMDLLFVSKDGHDYPLYALEHIVGNLGELEPELVPSGPAPYYQQSNAVAAIRQLTLMFAKEKALCAQPKRDEAVRQYVTTDQELDIPLGTSERAVSSSRAADSHGSERLSQSYSAWLSLR